MISPYSFNGVLLNPADHFFKSDLRGAFSATKDLTLVDLLTDGQAWGRSKVKERTLVLNIISGGYDLARITTLNAMLRGNALKPLVIDTDIGWLVGYAEVVNFSWSDETALRISAQLTMPDPYWYAQAAKSVQLGATYSNGVVFGPRKNLFNPAVGSVTSNGVTCTVAADGTITLDGTATKLALIEIMPILQATTATNPTALFSLISSSKYTLSETIVSGTKSTSYILGMFDTAGYSGADKIFDVYSNVLPYTMTAGVINAGGSSTSLNAGFLRLYINSGTTFSAYTFRLQLEQNSTATAWVPYNSGPGVTFGPRNAIQNGDFSKDSNGDGVPDGFVLSNASPVSLAGGEFVFRATAQYGSCSYGTALTPGHRYFIRANVLAYSSAVKLQATKGSGSYQNVLHPGDGAYHTLDFVVDIPPGFFSATCYAQDGSASGWANIGVKDFRAVDMGTAANPTPDYTLAADQMAAKYPNYQQEYGGVTFGTSTGGAATLTNDGNADAYPVIVVVGTCSSPVVTNLTTGETIAVNVALGDADELVIDCRPATCGVYLNGVANIGLKTSPGWMRCVPGDNQIAFARNSLQNKKHCTVELNERWI